VDSKDKELRNKPEKELLNKTNAAEVLGVTRQTIRKWQKRDYGPTFIMTPSGREYTTRTSCHEFLACFSSKSDQPK